MLWSIFQDGSIREVRTNSKAKVNGITDADFQKLVTKAEKKIVQFKLLNTEISFEAVLG
jgi:organic hydroperoxide reductase OsmC/OhrA